MSDESPAPVTPKKEITVKTFVDPEVLQNDLKFTDTDLDTPMMQQAALFARYAVLSAQAQKQVDDLKLRADVVEAKLDKQIRDEAVAAGAKITEAQIAKEISRKSDFVKIQAAINEARMVADLLKNALEALKQRRDMLIQVGVARREEMKGDLALRGPEIREEAQRDRRASFIEKMKEH